MRALLRILREDRQFLGTAIAGGLAFALVIAIPTVLIPNPFFARMIETRWWDYVVWLGAAPLAGISLALYRRRTCPIGRTAAGAAATLFAVGCPTCNALVIALLGASGAMTYFAPIQPLLGIAGLALLFGVVRSQLGAMQASAGDPVTSETGASSR